MQEIWDAMWIPGLQIIRIEREEEYYKQCFLKDHWRKPSHDKKHIL